MFDQAALAAIDAAVKKTDSKATFFALKLASAVVLGEPGLLTNGDRFVAPAALAPVLKQLYPSHLLLVRTHRTESKIKALREGVGNGMLEGLGFFVDDETVLKVDANNERHRVFLAPYTYVKLSLINLASGKCRAKKSSPRARPCSATAKRRPLIPGKRSIETQQH